MLALPPLINSFLSTQLVSSVRTAGCEGRHIVSRKYQEGPLREFLGMGPSVGRYSSREAFQHVPSVLMEVVVGLHCTIVRSFPPEVRFDKCGTCEHLYFPSELSGYI